MASQAMQVELPTGEVIWARVNVDGPTNVATGPLQRLDIDDLRQTVRGVSASLRRALVDLAPDQLQVEFGLELTVKAGKLTSVLAEAGATATVKVSLAWNRQPDGGAPAAEATGAGTNGAGATPAVEQADDA